MVTAMALCEIIDRWPNSLIEETMDKAIATARTMTIIGAVPMVLFGALWLLSVVVQSMGGTVPLATGHSSFFWFPIAGILSALICIPSGAVWLVLESIRLGRGSN